MRTHCGFGIQGCRHAEVTDIRRTSAHLGGDYLQQPRRLSHTTAFIQCAARMRCTWNGVVLGLPKRLPDDLARSSPAITRSRIIARSNSLNTPNIPNSILPDGVEVSRACWCR